ncbi:penicillin-binding protein activator [Vibrio algarum]|uniref:Penicillin-binding protein activator LpoA n=1 Tax=Vibrio algarum TaxID=3020714 RepID=A0ABT4YNK8_9VIBR|nr:penicillin-binding protein activator [Vibrio sp. KJ40-1]MDB1122987.1 penicillin-binding protein activator [Vibrio sp. KJ40-1]
MPKKNQQRISVPRLITPIALAIVLAACSSQPNSPEKIDITLDPTLSAQAYIVKADTLGSSLQNDWLIMALKAATAEGNTEQAGFLITRIEKLQLSEIQQAEWQLARAKHLMLTGQSTEALQQLNFAQWWELPQEQWKDYHAMRAELFSQLGDHINASRETILLSQYLKPEEQEIIAEQIWSQLSKYSQFDISNLSAQQNEPDLTAWLQLAVYMKTLGTNATQLKDVLETWLQENPDHLAALYVPSDVQAILDLEIVQPKSTALLLPLTGKYEKQAKLVRDGFLMALMNDNTRDSDAILTVIDTNKVNNQQLAQKLDEESIDFIVGPLMKKNIEELTMIQSERAQKIPTLALNIPNETDPTFNTCYLTLSPEQEVEQAAKHLFSQGFQYPLILAPKGTLGTRVAIAFQNEWKKYSNNQAVVSYFGTKAQLQKNINSTLGINASQSRIVQMENLMAMQLENQARSRRDIDSIYIVAKSSELTLIKPFIEVAINPEAKPPKLFANSRSNDGGKRQFEDLSGVIFSDIPMLVESNSTLLTQLDELWPNQSNSQKRLQALGMDAYQLTNELPQMKVVQDYKIEAKTGTLSIDQQCVVQREIGWAEHESL